MKHDELMELIGKIDVVKDQQEAQIEAIKETVAAAYDARIDVTVSYFEKEGDRDLRIVFMNNLLKGLPAEEVIYNLVCRLAEVEQ